MGLFIGLSVITFLMTALYALACWPLRPYDRVKGLQSVSEYMRDAVTCFVILELMVGAFCLAKASL